MKKTCTVLVSRLFDFIVRPLYWFLRKLLFDANVFAEHHGVIIADFDAKENKYPFFILRTKEVLDYMADIDPRRFNRVKREIKIIIKAEKFVSYGGKFDKNIGACFVNIYVLPYEENPNEAIRAYACILVHEATHGVMMRRGIPSSAFMSKAAKLRVERVCIEEIGRASCRERV